MYPISASKTLRLWEIADHWAGELPPPNRYRQVLGELIKAWWCGEFGPKEAARRLAALKQLYKDNQDVISFVAPGHAEPETKRELPDGGVKVLRLCRVPLPNHDPNSWTQINCAEAFEVLSEKWI
jgi:hypothetical protein